MDFSTFITSKTGLIHFLSSIAALLFGTMILLLPKGSSTHKRIGKLYGLAMLVVLVTAFMIYQLFGRWGIFHWTAIISSATLLAGMVPMYLKRPRKSYVALHISFMYWSVMGLYGAFVSETLVRMPKVVIESGIPNSVFYNMTGVGTALVMGLGVFYFIKLRPSWLEKFTKQGL